MNGFLLWAPRILTIAFAAFLSIFALDVFGEGHGFWRTAGELLLHLIPTFLILLILAVAWRREWLGALLFIAIAALYVVTSRGRFPISVYFAIAGPVTIAAIIFLVSWKYRSRLRAS